MGERFVSASDISGGAFQLEAQEIIMLSFYFPLLFPCAKNDNMEASHPYLVRMFLMRPGNNVSSLSNDKGRLSTLSSEGGPPVSLIM